MSLFLSSEEPSTVRAQRPDRGVRIALLLLWFGLAGLLASRHVMWRDEVRAFSIALQGNDVAAMLRGLHGEGHPALWYLLLRGLHEIVPVRQVLPGLAFVVGAFAMTLFVLRAPFRPIVLAVVLFGAFGLYEYVVSARNYGISMAILFLIADIYPRYRDRGWPIGFLLLLLSNTNVHSVLLAGAFLLFWAIELIGEGGVRWTSAWKAWLIAAALCALGIVACVAEIYPPYNDAAQTMLAPGSVPGRAMSALIAPGQQFWMLGLSGLPGIGRAGTLLLSICLLFSPLAFARRPGALIAAAVAVAGFSLFFALVYPGFYRHEALILVFLLTMAWLVADGRGGRWPTTFAPTGRWQGVASGAGFGLLFVLLASQVERSAAIGSALLHDNPESRVNDLARLLARPDLKRAIVIADPDFLLEPLPYYAPNPIYLLREHRYGTVVAFSRKAFRTTDFGDILTTARWLHTTTRRPVVILIQVPLDPSARVTTMWRGFYGPLRIDPVQVQAFRLATRRIASFGPAISGEFYSVYQLN